jgi:hypothetical protein
MGIDHVKINTDLFHLFLPFSFLNFSKKSNSVKHSNDIRSNSYSSTLHYSN